MANDYMAKLAADLEGMSMMREPEPMPIIYRQEGGDFGGFGNFGDDFGDYGPGGASDAEAGGGGANEGGADDGTYTEEQLTTLANLPGLTDPAYSDDALDPDGPAYTDEGLGGDKFTLAPYNTRTGIQQQKQDFEKEGIPKEFVPYYNSLKDRGLSNEQAMATLAAVAGTPGGAGALSSGYTDGYSYGGPMGTLEDLIETGQTASLEQRAKKAREKQEKEDKENEGPFDEAGEFQQEPGFFENLLNFDDFSLDSLNPLSTTLTPAQQAIKDSLSDQGLIVQERGALDKGLGFIGSAMLPTELGVAKFVAENVTNTGIFATAIDPVTGFEYLVDNSGGLQLAADQLGDAPNQDAGNEPIITTQRKVATKKSKEEDKKEEKKEKDYFPKQKLPRLSQSGLETLQYAYRNDPPEVLDNILNKYTLPDQTSGLKALV